MNGLHESTILRQLKKLLYNAFVNNVLTIYEHMYKCFIKGTVMWNCKVLQIHLEDFNIMGSINTPEFIDYNLTIHKDTKH